MIRIHEKVRIKIILIDFIVILNLFLGSSALGYGDDADKDDYSLQSTYRRNRYSPPTNNYRSRSRWPSSQENDWSRSGYGLK